MSEVEASPNAYVKDLTTTVPIFVKEGAVVSWSHKSLMEYFAAMCICFDTKGEQQELLIKIYDSEKLQSYLNVLELCSDIDYTSFRSSIVKRVLSDFINYSDTNYTEIKNSRIKRGSIALRLGLTFSTEIEFAYCAVDEETDKEWVKNNLIPLVEAVSEKSWALHALTYNGKSVPTILTYNNNPARLTMPIIKRKNERLFFSKKDIDNPGNKLAETLIKSSIKEKTFNKVHDNPKSIINNSKNFDITNKILWMSSPIALNLSKAKEELERIKRDESDGMKNLLSGF